jgi:sulfur carrier protein
LTIRLNGDSFEIAGPVTITALLARLEIDPRIVAVEHNVVVVKKQHYETTLIREGDEIEIVRFVGGG